MNLYLLTQDENSGWDTHDAMVVAAESADAARMIHPREEMWGPQPDQWDRPYSSWASSPGKVNVVCIGVAKDDVEAGVVLSSFIAG
jgi:hypothetical protein